MDQDSEGPSLEAISLSQMRELPPNRHQGVLQHVLGEIGIAENPPGDAQEGVTDPVHQISERFLVAGTGSLHHVSIQRGLRCGGAPPPSTDDEGRDHRNRSAPRRISAYRSKRHASRSYQLRY